MHAFFGMPVPTYLYLSSILSCQDVNPGLLNQRHNSCLCPMMPPSAQSLNKIQTATFRVQAKKSQNSFVDIKYFSERGKIWVGSVSFASLVALVKNIRIGPSLVKKNLSSGNPQNGLKRQLASCWLFGRNLLKRVSSEFTNCLH